MSKVPVNPLVLKWARETANLSINEVTKKVNKSSEVIEAWENGTDAPSYIQLEKLAYGVYKRPLAVFFFPVPPKEENTKKSFRTIPDAEFEKLPASLIKLFRKARVKQENLYELCDGSNPSGKNLIGTFRNVEKSNIVELSIEIKKFLGINLSEQKGWDSTETALNAWRKAFEDSGIFVFKDAFRDDEISGFCLYDEIFPLIVINNSMPKNRQIFTLFHELGHILFQTSGIDKLDDRDILLLPEIGRSIEVNCNRLAAEVLVPQKDFESHIKDIKRL